MPIAPNFCRRTLAVLVLAGGLVASAPAQVPDSILNEDPVASSSAPIPDKIEGLNRFFFNFNDGFYRYVLRPVSKGYAAVVPKPVRRGIGNFFDNLRYPTRLVGNLLEGEPKGALKETGRFLINTTAGLAGIFPVANDFPELRVPESDLGQAFATWGIGHGTYLVLPILGPTSLRDGIGQGASGIYLSPVHYLQEWEYRAVANGVDGINQMPETMETYFNFKSGAIDAYASLRDAFAARRAQMVRERPGNTDKFVPPDPAPGAK